ncbi:hypothetical protein SpCBS45565_g01131 [Spizellomyces sp. 'palustris']|nr:hypothetical protein SpCBS45565_g01131 [Spizellomyces sp. 'palustris']
MSNKVWRITKHEGIENLRLTTEDVPKPGPDQVLLRVRAVSLNYRDWAVLNGFYPRPYAEEGRLIPCSDAAGDIVEIGEGVTKVKKGQRVCSLFFQTWFKGEMEEEDMLQTLGAPIHGVLAQYVVLSQDGVIKFPDFLSYEEAATLPCAALTAWQGTFVTTRHVGPHCTTLTQGTGGVSIFALQFARLAGNRVIVTSSTDEKLAKAKELGADDLINYRKTPEWHQEARKINDGRGIDNVIEIGGPGTINRSLQAIKKYGDVQAIGFRTQGTDSNVATEMVYSCSQVHGIFVGNKKMFEDMNRQVSVTTYL